MTTAEVEKALKEGVEALMAQTETLALRALTLIDDVRKTMRPDATPAQAFALAESLPHVLAAVQRARYAARDARERAGAF